MDFWWNNMPSGGKAIQVFEEDPLESQCRQDAGFPKVETMLRERLTLAGVSSVGKIATLPDVAATSLFSFFGYKNPFVRTARADRDRVWILENTAWQSGDTSDWQAEYTTCFFQRGRADITKAVSAIVDAIGLDGEAGSTAQSRQLIASRIMPFIDAPAPARRIPVLIGLDGGGSARYMLGPSNANGINTQVCQLQHPGSGDNVHLGVDEDVSVHDLPDVHSVTRVFQKQGFGVISDIDDTIKITQTPNPVGILRTTFAEPAQFTSHMPDFYKIIHEQLQGPAWFYVSASPYNLYPFLREFIHQYYLPGQILLRDASWQTLGGLLGSLTQGVKAYKSNQIDKINRWFPERKFICIGDSTQMDPETYAAMYKKHGNWIQAIYIRKVLDAPFMETKNKDERFQRAFEGVPESVWRVFVLPDELSEHFANLVAEQKLKVHDKLKNYSCGPDRKQQLEQDRVEIALM